VKEPRVIYILGLGRSGTTMLDVILGNAENTFSCGELNRYPFEEGVPYQFPAEHPSVNFWEIIKTKMDAKYGSKEYGMMREFSRKYEYHSGFLRNYFGINNRSNSFNSLLKFYEDLYESIMLKSGHSLLIDSSKYSNRALFLSNSKKFEISYVYIQRDPVNVVNSFAKKDVEQGSRNWFSANYYYFFASLLCSLAVYKLRRKGAKVCKIRHEELLDNPLRTVRFIEESLNVDMSNIKKIVSEQDSFNVGTLFYGNRVRLLDTLTLKRTMSSRKTVYDRITRIVNYIWYR
jgi:hypothetical protein